VTRRCDKTRDKLSQTAAVNAATLTHVDENQRSSGRDQTTDGLEQLVCSAANGQFANNINYDTTSDLSLTEFKFAHRHDCAPE
jgi:hypothetical protein